MPNWCSNTLTVTGSEEDMIPFLKTITRKVNEDNTLAEDSQEDWDIKKFEDYKINLLHNLYPTPEELLIGDVSFTPDEKQIANQEKYGYKSWYEWRISKWGTKWGENDLYVQQQPIPYAGKMTIVMHFETAWSPAIEAFDKITEDYPNLLFCLYYEESGMAFCGNNVWANGECVESNQAELISDYFDEDYLFEQYIINNKEGN